MLQGAGEIVRWGQGERGKAGPDPVPSSSLEATSLEDP